MKIVILMGSPNMNGSTSILADSFERGAEEKGHSVETINVCTLNVNPCTGCIACGYEGDCVQNDDNERIRRALLSCDMVMFATPLYTMECRRSSKQLLTDFAHTTAALTEDI